MRLLSTRHFSVNKLAFLLSWGFWKKWRRQSLHKKVWEVDGIAHTYNPSTWEMERQEDQKVKFILIYIVSPRSARTAWDLVLINITIILLLITLILKAFHLCFKYLYFIVKATQKWMFSLWRLPWLLGWIWMTIRNLSRTINWIIKQARVTEFSRIV